MRIVFDIATDNGAFVDNEREFARIITDSVDRIAQDERGEFPLYDGNGNRVGKCKVTTRKGTRNEH